MMLITADNADFEKAVGTMGTKATWHHDETHVAAGFFTSRGTTKDLGCNVQSHRCWSK